MRSSALAALALPLALLTGCLDFTEEVWVHRDQSARAAWTYGVEEELLTPEQAEGLQHDLEQSAEELAAREGVTRAEGRYALRDGLHEFTLDVSVAHYRDLESLLAQVEATTERVGRVTAQSVLQPGSPVLWTAASQVSPLRFEPREGGGLRFVRDLGSEGQALRSAVHAGRALQAPRGDEQPREHRLTWRFHAPRVDRAEEATDLSRGRAEWSYGVEDEAIPAALTAEFHLAPAIPWGLVVVGAGAAAGFVWLRRKWQQRWM